MTSVTVRCRPDGRQTSTKAPPIREEMFYKCPSYLLCPGGGECPGLEARGIQWDPRIASL